MEQILDTVRGWDARQRVLAGSVVVAMCVVATVFALAGGGTVEADVGSSPPVQPALDRNEDGTSGSTALDESTIVGTPTGEPQVQQLEQPGEVASLAPLAGGSGGGASPAQAIEGQAAAEQDAWERYQQEIVPTDDPGVGEPDVSPEVAAAAAIALRVGEVYLECVRTAPDPRGCIKHLEDGAYLDGVPPKDGEGMQLAVRSSDGHIVRLSVIGGVECHMIDDEPGCNQW